MVERYLPDVLDRMIDMTPKGLVNNEFIDKLAAIKENALYCPPEMMHVWWNAVQKCLEENLPDPNNLNYWQKRVVNIWMNKND